MRVVDLTVNVLGPVATQVLGDMGADVIKIETPGRSESRHGAVAPRGHVGDAHERESQQAQRHAQPEAPDALDTLMRLVETADVFVHSMRPAAAERLGVGYEAIAQRNPRIIYAFGPATARMVPIGTIPALTTWCREKAASPA